MKYFERYPKRDAIRNYFPLPNELFGLGLIPGEISVYCYLMFRENRETHQCHPSYKTIGRALQMSTNTVKKYVDRLREKHLIDTEPTAIVTKDGIKRNGNLLYTIRPIEEAVRCHLEMQVRESQEKQERLRRIAAMEAYDRKHSQKAVGNEAG